MHIQLTWISTARLFVFMDVVPEKTETKISKCDSDLSERISKSECGIAQFDEVVGILSFLNMLFSKFKRK